MLPNQPGPTDLLVDAIAQRVAELVLPQLREELANREAPPAEKRLLSPREVAKLYRHSPNTVYKALSAGELRYTTRNGRYWIRPDDAKEWEERLGG